MLLAMQADPSTMGRDGTAIDLAHKDVRLLLLERGMLNQIKAANEAERFAEHSGCLQHGVAAGGIAARDTSAAHREVPATDVEQEVFLDLAKEQNWDMVKEMLRANPALVDCSAGGRWTALMQASDSGNRRAVKMLLAKKADPTIRGRDGRTALDLAHQDVRLLLLERVLKISRQLA